MSIMMIASRGTSPKLRSPAGLSSRRQSCLCHWSASPPCTSRRQEACPCTAQWTSILERRPHAPVRLHSVRVCVCVGGGTDAGVEGQALLLLLV